MGLKDLFKHIMPNSEEKVQKPKKQMNVNAEKKVPNQECTSKDSVNNTSNNTACSTTTLTDNTPGKNNLSTTIPPESKTIIISSKDSEVKNETIKIKPLKNFQLRIFLIENTLELEKMQHRVSQIFENFGTSEFIIINYGSNVRKIDIIEKNDFNKDEFFVDEDLGENACLYDALIEIENIVKKYYLITKELDDKKIFIDSIEIIGIGTGIDNFSNVSEKLAMESFVRVTKLDRVTTKYFCLDEKNIMNPARIGFRSIGVIPKS